MVIEIIVVKVDVVVIDMNSNVGMSYVQNHYSVHFKYCTNHSIHFK